MKFVGVPSCAACTNIPLNIKDALSIWIANKEKEADCLVDLFGCWRQHLPPLGTFVWLIYSVTWKPPTLEWCPEEENNLQQVHAVVQGGVSLQSYCPANPVVSKCQWPLLMLFVVSSKLLCRLLWRPLGFWRRSLPYSPENCSPKEKKSPWHATGP